MAYRESGEVRDIAVDPEELLAAQKRSAKRRLVAVVVAVAVLGAAATAIALVAHSRSRAASQAAWDRFATCLVGAPLAAGEAPSVRVRNLQLAAMGVRPEKRTAANEGVWPARCSSPGHAVAETMRASGGSTALAEASEKLAKAIAVDTGVAADLAPLVEKVFAEAATEKLAHRRAAGIAEPDAPATPMTLATLPAAARMFGGPLALASIRFAPFADATLHFVVDDKDFAPGPVACSFAPGAADIACRKIGAPAAQLSPALRLWGTTAEGAAPYVFAGDRGKAGIFRSDTGARVVEKLEYGAYGATALADGSLGYLLWNEKGAPSRAGGPPGQTDFVRVTADGATSKPQRVVVRSESGNPWYSTSVLWEHVAFKQVRKDAEGIRLVVRPIAASGELGAPIDVGRIDEVGHIEGGSEEEPHLTGCRAKDTTVIRAKGWHNTFLSFFVAGRWTPPVEAPGLRGHLQCRPGEAVVTRVWGGQSGSRFKGGINQSRCTVSGCDERNVDVNKMLADVTDVLPHDAKDIRAVDLDGKLLVVWSAGDRGGVRMRLAPADQIAQAADVVVFEDHLREGTYRVESTLVDLQLLPSANGALLLLGTIDGVYAFAADATGKLRAVATRM